MIFPPERFAAREIIEALPDREDVLLVFAAARPLAKLAGYYHVPWSTASDPLRWLAEDHPTRVNLILESMGRPERLK